MGRMSAIHVALSEAGITDEQFADNQVFFWSEEPLDFDNAIVPLAERPTTREAAMDREELETLELMAEIEEMRHYGYV